MSPPVLRVSCASAPSAPCQGWPAWLQSTGHNLGLSIAALLPQRVATEGLQFRLVDARGQVVGRLASQIAQMLMGKDKPTYQPHKDEGDVVVVVNAQEVEFTGAWRPMAGDRRTGQAHTLPGTAWVEGAERGSVAGPACGAPPVHAACTQH